MTDPLGKVGVAVVVQSVGDHALGASEDLGQLGLLSVWDDYFLFFVHFVWMFEEKSLYLGRE